MSGWSDQTTLTGSTEPIVEAWVDGSCLDNGSPDAVGGVGCVIESKESTIEVREPVPSNDRVTNNRAEYFAVLSALDRIDEKYSTDVGVRIYSDSELVVKQIRGRYRVGDSLENINKNIQSALNEFRYWEIKQRSECEAHGIKRADELAKEAARKATGRSWR